MVEGSPRWGGLIWGSMEAGKASRSAMGSGLLRAAHMHADRPDLPLHAATVIAVATV